MDATSMEITEYKYGFLNSATFQDRRMVAHLYSDKDLIAIAYFQKEHRSPRVNNRGTIHLFFPMEDAAGFIDMLRNEKPIYLHFDPKPQDPQAFVSTDREPIGEGE